MAAQLPADPVPVPAGGGSGLVESGRLILAGLAVINTAATAGTVQVLDGVDSKGQAVAAYAVAASGGLNPFLPTSGIVLEVGCYLVVTNATLSGAIQLIHLWRYPFTPPAE
jgi:hypothetical protein